MSPSKSLEPAWAVRSCTEADCHWLSINLTKGAEEELKAFSKFAPMTTLLQDFESKAVIVDSRHTTKPIAIFEKVKPIPGRKAGAIWVGLTDIIVASEWFWSFTSYADALVGHMQAETPALFTYVDARNLRHTLWLERIGFHLVETIPQFGPKEIPTKLYKRSKAKNV